MADKTIVRHRGRWWFAVGLLATLTVVFLSLGQWQLGRAELRREMATSIAAGRGSPPVTLSGLEQTGLADWRPAIATGRWLSQWSVLLDNRNLDGKPGLWLATPLELTDGTAVLVLRGWLPRPIGQYNALPVLTDPTSPVRVQGELFGRVPALYALGRESDLSFSGRKAPTEAAKVNLNQVPRRQNLSLEELSKSSGLKLLPVVLMQTSVDSLSLDRRWPGPSIDADKNTGYAMQWFGFAAIALGATGALLWRLLRREKISA